MGKTLYTVVVLACCAALTSALSCLECGTYPCPKPKCGKRVTIVKDACRCCDVCSKQLYQKCGGPFGIVGTCDPKKRLVCVEKPICDEDSVMFPANGNCLRKRDVKIVQRLCKLSGLICPKPKPPPFYRLDK